MEASEEEGLRRATRQRRVQPVDSQQINDPGRSCLRYNLGSLDRLPACQPAYSKILDVGMALAKNACR